MADLEIILAVLKGSEHAVPDLPFNPLADLMCLYCRQVDTEINFWLEQFMCLSL